MSLLARIQCKRLLYCLRSLRCYSEMPDREKPVKFTTSGAADWRAEFTRRGNIYDDSPDCQPFVVSISLGIFLFYFLYYREESDIDENFNLTREIYSKVDGLEEVQLKLYRNEQLKQGKDVTQIDIRLNELEKIRLQKSV